MTRKISHGVARIKAGLQEKLVLGNLEAARDWGFAGDYVRAMWLMLQQDRAGDFVVGTGISHTVRDFCRLSFARAGLDWQEHVELDPRFLRPAEVDRLVADPARAKSELGWSPQCSFEELVGNMVDADIERVAGRRASGVDS